MTAAVFFIAGFENRGAANAATLYDVFSERHLEFYENEVAKEKVFSKYSERELAKMAVDNDISIEKVKKLLVYCHAMKNIGKNYTIKEADKLSNANKIVDNVKEFLSVIVRLKPSSAKGTYVKSVYLSSTMSPGVHVDFKVGDA